MNNPYERDGRWYFYDEVEDEQGPFPTEEKAKQEFRLYMVYLDSGSMGLSKAFREEILRLENKLLDTSMALKISRKVYEEKSRKNDFLKAERISAFKALGVHLTDEGPDLDAYVDGHVDSLSNIIGELRAELAEEKDRRVYYQDIVYRVCSCLQADTVSGTKNSPSTEVQDGVYRITAELDEAKKEIKWLKKEAELHELETQQDKDRVQVLEGEVTGLRHDLEKAEAKLKEEECG